MGWFLKCNIYYLSHSSKKEYIERLVAEKRLNDCDMRFRALFMKPCDRHPDVTLIRVKEKYLKQRLEFGTGEYIAAGMNVSEKRREREPKLRIFPENGTDIQQKAVPSKEGQAIQNDV